MPRSLTTMRTRGTYVAFCYREPGGFSLRRGEEGFLQESRKKGHRVLGMDIPRMDMDFAVLVGGMWWCAGVKNDCGGMAGHRSTIGAPTFLGKSVILP